MVGALSVTDCDSVVMMSNTGTDRAHQHERFSRHGTLDRECAALSNLHTGISSLPEKLEGLAEEPLAAEGALSDVELESRVPRSLDATDKSLDAESRSLDDGDESLDDGTSWTT